jgi:hypothetical protein
MLMKCYRCQAQAKTLLPLVIDDQLQYFCLECYQAHLAIPQNQFEELEEFEERK